MAFVDHESWSIVRCNPQFARLLGYDESELEGKSLQDLYHASDSGTYRESLKRVLDGDEECMDSVKRFIAKHGGSIICRTICHPLRFEGHVAIMLKQICIVADDRIQQESVMLRDTVRQLERDLANLTGDVRALVGKPNDSSVHIGESSIRSGAQQNTNDAAIFRWIVAALVVLIGAASYLIYVGGWPLHKGGASPPTQQTFPQVQD